MQVDDPYADVALPSNYPKKWADAAATAYAGVTDEEGTQMSELADRRRDSAAQQSSTSQASAPPTDAELASRRRDGAAQQSKSRLSAPPSDAQVSSAASRFRVHAVFSRCLLVHGCLPGQLCSRRLGLQAKYKPAVTPDVVFAPLVCTSRAVLERCTWAAALTPAVRPDLP